MTVFYKKVGRRYQPVSEYDSELMSAFPKGAHLVITYPGGRSTRYNIDPALAPMIAAGRTAEDAIATAVAKAMELRDNVTPYTKRQKELIRELTSTMKAQDIKWIRPAARDAANAGVRALMDEADNLMKHPAVKQAYEHFLLVSKLTQGVEE